MKWTDYLDDPALREFSGQERGRTRILARPDHAEWAWDVVEGNISTDGGPSVGGGRAVHPLVRLRDGGWAVVRRFRRGGAMRHLNHDRYFLGQRAFAELWATERARGTGVRVPEVLAAVQRRRAIGYDALLATRWIPDSAGLERWLAERDREAGLIALVQAGEQIGRMHEAGIAHPDLNLRNLLVSAAPTAPGPLVHLIDFDRARVGDRPVNPPRRIRDLKRLARSARKLGIALDTERRHALRNGYGADWPADLDFG